MRLREIFRAWSYPGAELCDICSIHSRGESNRISAFDFAVSPLTRWYFVTVG